MTRCEHNTFFPTDRSIPPTTRGGASSWGRDHANFTLDIRGVVLRNYGADVTLIDVVDTGTQQPGALRGCLAESGSTGALSFPTNAPLALNLIWSPSLGGGKTVSAGSPRPAFLGWAGVSTNPASPFDPLVATTTLPPSDGREDAFPSRVALASPNNLVVVDFDPVADPAALATFCARFGAETTTIFIFGAREGEPSGLAEARRFHHSVTQDQPRPVSAR